jgi:hypothetical protein
MLDEAVPTEDGQRTYRTYTTDPVRDLVVSAVRSFPKGTFMPHAPLRPFLPTVGEARSEQA